MTHGLGSQDRDKGPASLLSLLVSLPPCRAPTLVLTMNPKPLLDFLTLTNHPDWKTPLWLLHGVQLGSPEGCIPCAQLIKSQCAAVGLPGWNSHTLLISYTVVPRLARSIRPRL